MLSTKSLVPGNFGQKKMKKLDLVKNKNFVQKFGQDHVAEKQNFVKKVLVKKFGIKSRV